MSAKLKGPKRAAFTLVELSIVLVILGLLVGGVLTGQSLIRAAELRSIITQYNGYVTATYTFRDKYFAIPGDMPNATSFWGAAHATPATCITTIGTAPRTCNGDGNGMIDLSSGSNETFRFWQHLSNAGLVEGSYSGITDGSTTTSYTKTNSPVGKIGNTLWETHWAGTFAGHAAAFAGEYGNTLFVGGMVANSFPSNPILKPEEAWNIDTKLDDGRPALGKVVVYGWPACTDAALSTTLTANYRLDGRTPACSLYFRQAY